MAPDSSPDRLLRAQCPGFFWGCSHETEHEGALRNNGCRLGKQDSAAAVAAASGRSALGVAALLGLLLSVQPAHADCFAAASQRFSVDAELLRAVARVESSMRADAVGVNRSASRDLGLMQINSSWLPTLARFGITEQQLFEPCTNIQVGAWILAGAIAQHGATWQAVGAYNAACTQLKGAQCERARARYAWKVYRQMRPSVLASARAHPQALKAEQAQLEQAAFVRTGLVSATAAAQQGPFSDVDDFARATFSLNELGAPGGFVP